MPVRMQLDPWSSALPSFWSLGLEGEPKAGESPPPSLSPKLTLLLTVLSGVHRHPSSQTPLHTHTTPRPPANPSLLASRGVVQGPAPQGAAETRRILGPVPDLLNQKLHFNETSRGVVWAH